jgi:hypothetical protein
MSPMRSALLVLLLSSTAAMAAPAKDESIKQLLAVTHAQKLAEGMRTQFDVMVDNIVQQALKGKPPTANEQQAITRMKTKMATLFQGQFAWDKLEPMYLRLYKAAFSEDEVDGMLAFYKTPAGQAAVTKMPGVLQRTMTEIQATMGHLAPQLQAAQQEFLAEVKAVHK